MPNIKLDREEAEAGDLPDLCMQCGETAPERVTRNFSWTPPTAAFMGGLIGIMIAAAFTKRMKAQVPLCEQHKNHWSWRNLVTLVGLLVPAAPLVGGILLVATESAQDLPGLTAGLFIAALVLFIVWLIVIAVLNSTAIRVVEMTDQSVTLAGVHQAFVDELYRRDEEEDEDDYEDDRPRRRRPPPGSFRDR